MTAEDRRTGAAASPASPTSGATHRAIFGPLAHTDAASAVVRRLRSAIGVGLLSPGERLPREADLARQLGVTVFSLREALGVLRDEGLIVTRPGKNGGSFAQPPSDPAPTARAMLTQLSTSELVDLGDWRRMLTSRCAALAAQRASSSSVERLASFAGQVASASQSREARYAFGRFHLELAAAAQSARLTRAELTMNEEFNLLVILLLDDPASRARCARSLQEIVAAIGDNDGERAGQCGDRSQGALVTELVRMRLHHLATGASPRRATVTLESAVRQFAEQAIRRLDHIATHAAASLGSEAPAIATSRIVGRAILDGLGGIEPVVDGLGVIADVDVVPRHRYWIDWWHRGGDGRFERDPSHVMDPAHEDFYDYTKREFMTRPKASHAPWASGPYVDYGGVDDYVVTISVPILRDGRFLGVSAADVRVADLETYFAPWLAAQAAPCVVVNSESRVLLSNSPERTIGSIAPHVDPGRALDLGYFGWSLAIGPG